MYVPLFAAVNAQYQKAQNVDHPRILALDEAFCWSGRQEYREYLSISTEDGI